MAFLFLPAQLAARGEFFHQIGSSLASGLTLVRTLGVLAENPPAGGLTGPIDRLLRQLQSGATFGEALRSLGRWASDFDIALIEAGEQSGRIDHVCGLLARSYEERARLARQIIIGLLYPAFLFHFAFLIMPVGQLVDLVKTGDIAAFVVRKLVFFVPFYLVLLVTLWAGQGTHGRAWRSLLETAFGLVPLFGKARRSLALARLSLALDALLNAGVATTRAWPLAGAASGSPALEREMSRWIPLLADGTPAGDLVQRSSRFPPHFSSVYATAEMSGRVDDALPRLHRHYQDEGMRLTKIAAGVLTGLVYFGILIAVAWQIVSFWLGYYGQILDLE
jgi:type IV pilus assembly protein PilC